MCISVVDWRVIHIYRSDNDDIAHVFCIYVFPSVILRKNFESLFLDLKPILTFIYLCVDHFLRILFVEIKPVLYSNFTEF